MSEAQNETPEVPEVDAPPDAEDPEIDKGAQAVELIGYVARECATFFKRLADGVRKYELTGDLPVRRGPAPKNGQKIGTEAPEKPKAKSKGRKGEDGEKVKAVLTTLAVLQPRAPVRAAQTKLLTRTAPRPFEKQLQPVETQLPSTGKNPAFLSSLRALT